MKMKFVLLVARHAYTPSTVNVSRNAIIFCQGKWHNIKNMVIQGNKAKVFYTGDTQGSPKYVTEFFF